MSDSFTGNPFGPGGRGQGPNLPGGLWEAVDQLREMFEQRMSPRVARGDVRAAVLAILAEKPLHGYQIIQEIERRSHGAWKPSPGSVYPTLQQLEDEGLVRAEEQEGRRVYRLTEDGTRVTAEKAEEFAGMWDAFTPREDDTQLGDLVFQVGAAFVHVMRTGSPEQIAQARKVLARTRSDLYRILGEDGAESGADTPEPDGTAS